MPAPCLLSTSARLQIVKIDDPLDITILSLTALPAQLASKPASRAACAALPTALQIFKIDDHMGIAISGLTADGRILCRYMRNECLNHRCASWPCFRAVASALCRCMRNG